MEFVTDASGKVTGNAKLGPFEFKIGGSVKPAVDSIPEGVELVVTVERVAAVYNLRGFFLANSDHIVGTVVSVGNIWFPTRRRVGTVCALPVKFVAAIGPMAVRRESTPWGGCGANEAAQGRATEAHPELPPRGLQARQRHAPEACLIASSSRPPL